MKILNLKICSAVFSLLLLCSPAALSHPPSDVEVMIEGDIITVTITHDVKDPAKHFIKEVEVNLNKKEIADKKESRQMDNDKQVEVFEVPGLKAGDELSVKAVCNKFGSKTRKITVR